MKEKKNRVVEISGVCIHPDFEGDFLGKILFEFTEDFIYYTWTIKRIDGEFLGQVSRPISLSFEGLVGMDFMAKYSVQIDTKKHVLYLNELPESPDSPAGHDEEWWRLNFHNFKSLRHNLQQYRDRLYSLNNDSGKKKKLREFADRQYDEANSMLDRLRVYASENSVPLQWR